jgi:hypothetical protein
VGFVVLKRLLAGVGLALLAAPAAQAANHGWYWGVDGGASLLNDSDTFSSGGILGLLRHHTVSFDTGWAVLATAGIPIFEHSRIEGEVGYRSNGSDVSDATLMGNVLYDFNVSSNARFSLGLGAGGGRLSIYDDTNFGFAAQGIAEIAFSIAPGTDLTVRGRLLWQSGGTFVKDRGALIQSTNDFDSFTNETITIGLRFAL